MKSDFSPWQTEIKTINCKICKAKRYTFQAAQHFIIEVNFYLLIFPNAKFLGKVSCPDYVFQLILAVEGASIIHSTSTEMRCGMKHLFAQIKLLTILGRQSQRLQI